MSLNNIVELIFTIVMLLFLATIVIAVLIGITFLQEMAAFETDGKIRVLFIVGMAVTFLYITKLIIDKIKEYNRFI